MVPTVQLTGAAIGGILPELDHLRAMVASQQPVEVKLGRLFNPGFRARRLCLEAYLDAAKVPVPPAKVDYFSNASPSLQRMYQNDRWGCCVISGKAHGLGVTSTYDSDSGGTVQATDQEIIDQYHGICGPGDNGCFIPAVLDVMVRKGFQAGGRLYKIDGYVGADWTNKLLVQVCLDIFGPLTIGLNLPQAWTSNSVWDVTNTPIVGGHDVTCVGYDSTGVQISTWGRVYVITWQAFLSTRWIEELWVILYQNWYGNDKLAPSGFNVDSLKADLAKINSGGIPDLDPVTPPPPPPPVGQVANFPETTLPVNIFGLPLGTVTIPHMFLPVTPSPAHFGAAIDAKWQDAMKLFGQALIDFATGNWSGLANDVYAILALFGILSAPTNASAAALKVSWIVLLVDLGKLVAAIRAKDVQAIIAAAQKLLVDLGIA